MIILNAALQEAAFRGLLVRGCIVYLIAEGGELSDPSITTRPKFVVVLECDTSRPEILGAFTTTQLKSCLRIPGNELFLPMNLSSYPCFTQATDLDLLGLIPFKRSSLLARYLSGKLEFKGTVSAGDMKMVDSLLRTKTQVSGEVRDRILPA